MKAKNKEKLSDFRIWQYKKYGLKEFRMRTIVTLANKAKSILWRIGFFSSREKTENYFVRTRSYAWGGVKKLKTI